MEYSWHPKAPPGETSDQAFVFRRKALSLVGLLALGLFVTAFGLYSLIGSANTTPPVVTVTADGRAFYTVPGEFTLNTEAVERQMQDVLYVLFNRTETGYLERLEHYCSDGVLPRLEAYYRGIAEKYPSGYLQQAKVVDAKFKRGVASRIEVWFELLIESRSEYESTQNTFFVATEFIFAPPTPQNAIGWKLNSISQVNRNEFFADELQQEIENKTKVQ